MSEFQEFVRENKKWFRGRNPETEASLNKVERELEIKLPEEIRWLLKTYGYWHGTGICSIEETIDETKLAREHAQLPNNYLVLYDHHDGGVILLDVNRDEKTGENRVIDTGWEAVPDKLEEEKVYPSFKAYTEIVIKNEADFLDEKDIECKE